MNNLKFSVIFLIFSSFLMAQKKSIQLKMMVSNNYVDKLYLRNKTHLILEIGLRKKDLFVAAFDIEDGVYQLTYDTFYTDVYLKKGTDLIISWDGFRFYETLKFAGIGANENNFIASEFKDDESSNENPIYDLNETEFENYMLTLEKKKLEKLSKEKFDVYFLEFEKKSVTAQLLNIRNKYLDRKLTEKRGK